jgi:catechol 2,3-dioxygenase-like lactoylglutathione lyase family enzyme
MARVSFAHFTLATMDVERTAGFFERTLGYRRTRVDVNAKADAVWFAIGNGQEMHVLHVSPFTISPFEAEYGRHVAVFHPKQDFAALKARLIEEGAEVIAPIRATPFERFFFREPINGYVFEVIEGPSHFDQ